MIPAFVGIIFVICAGLITGPTVFARPDADSVQQMLDKAEPGSVVRLPAGTYRGPIIIRKPLTVLGDGKVQIVAGEKDPALIVRTNGSNISGITVIDERNDRTAVAVFLQGNDNRLSRMTIRSQGFGIKAENADRNHFDTLTIEGPNAPPIDMRGNGIDLWDSDGNQIRNCTIRNKCDGIYLERGEKNRVEQNRVSGSRYGVHLMFTRETKVLNNFNQGNVSGILVMGTDKTVVRGNTLTKHMANVHSLGLLLYAVTNAEVSRNVINENRVGIYVEESEMNRIEHNTMAGNLIGVQWLKSKDNLFTRNNMISNIAQAQADQSDKNRMENNYWNDHRGLDFDGDSKSDLPYRAEPFYLTLTEHYPPYRLFFHSPGMALLKDLLTTESVKTWAADPKPLMGPAFEEEGGQPSTSPSLWMVSMLFLILGLIPFIMKGVIRQ